uniref:Uncharacterized protein n=1 Tax=Magallana gigas TaxID=29159 RepID=K1QY44_MAGGI
MNCKRLNNLGQDSDRAPLRLSPDDGHQLVFRGISPAQRGSGDIPVPPSFSGVW